MGAAIAALLSRGGGGAAGAGAGAERLEVVRAALAVERGVETACAAIEEYTNGRDRPRPARKLQPDIDTQQLEPHGPGLIEGEAACAASVHISNHGSDIDAQLELPRAKRPRERLYGLHAEGDTPP